MRKRILVVGAVVALLIAGGVFASNMGFKLNYLLSGAGGSSPQNATVIALPYNQQTNLVSALDLIEDVGGGPAGPANPVADVSFYSKPVDNWAGTYSGTSGTDFNLVAGDSYLLRLKAGQASINYIIVGSHNPAKIVTLTGNGTPSPQNATVYAYPYHSVASTALELIEEIGGPAGPANPVADISFYSKPVDNWAGTYSGTSGTNFNLVPGEGYLVRLKAGQPDLTFTPAHY